MIKDNQKYKILSKQRYVKESIDYCLEFRIRNKKTEYNWENTKNKLFEFCSMNKRVPKDKEIFYNKIRGNWLYRLKKNIKSEDDEKYKKLAKNPYVKESLDLYLKKDSKWNKNIKLLFEFCDLNKRTPTKLDKYKDKNIKNWLSKQKNKIKSKEDDIYKKLAENKYVKESLDNYLNPEKKWKEWKDLFFEFCNLYDRVPFQRELYKDRKIGQWFRSTQKTKIKSKEDELYKKLAVNKHVKESLDKYLNRKPKKRKVWVEVK